MSEEIKKKDKENRKEKTITSTSTTTSIQGGDEWRKRKALSNAFQSFDNSLTEITKKAKEERKDILKQGVMELEKNYGEVLRASKLAVKRIQEIRVKAGMSSSVGTSGVIKKPRFKGKEDYVNSLARELLVVVLEEHPGSGGVFNLESLYQVFKETRQNWDVKKKELLEAIHLLEKNKVIPGRTKFGEEEYILFRPIELSQDLGKVLKAAHGGITNISQLQELLGWEKERVARAIESLQKQGVCVVEGEEVFFPGLMS